jgi:hypothetical protein
MLRLQWIGGAWAQRDRDGEGTEGERKREREREREKNSGLASPHLPEDARDGHTDAGRLPAADVKLCSIQQTEPTMILHLYLRIQTTKDQTNCIGSRATWAQQLFLKANIKLSLVWKILSFENIYMETENWIQF